MGQKPPVVSISKLIETLKCPRCAWFMIHRGARLANDHQAATLRNKHLIRKQYDRARSSPGIPRELGWPRSVYWPGAVLFASQDVADRLRYRMKYFDKKNGFVVRGQIDDALFALTERDYIPVRIMFPGSEDREISKLEQARFDESVRLMRECGFRVPGYAIKISYLFAPGSRGRAPGWRCEIAAVDASARRSSRLHRLMKTIINLKKPPRASEDCVRHQLVHEEVRLLRAKR